LRISPLREGTDMPMCHKRGVRLTKLIVVLVVMVQDLFQAMQLEIKLSKLQFYPCNMM